ncbi:MAG: PEP-CTERM sorting domain-containing protein [Phycisphaeraceae bacterium]|nr:PEP-CTERM sorting domain-containing protein [Phycisphaeraceae bacterium]
MQTESRLHRYAIAAASVPLATLATTQSVVADIVYESTEGLTIGSFGAIPDYTVLSIGDYGAIQLAAGHNSAGPEYLFRAVAVSDSKGGERPIGMVVNFSSGSSKVLELQRFAAGDLIGSAGSLNKSGIGVSGKDEVFVEGPFAEGGSGYLGFAIEMEGVGEEAYRYGWIGVAWDPSTFELTIDGFAYETDAGVGIAAGAIPAPGALGLFGLAAGAAGIRRKRHV